MSMLATKIGNENYKSYTGNSKSDKRHARPVH